MTGASAPKVSAPSCYRCGGSGTYTWGGSVNGVPVHSGACFACQGGGEYAPNQGKYSRRDKRRTTTPKEG